MKVKEKHKKENEKKELLEKQKLLGEHWAMLKWVTSFIKEKEDSWEAERKEKEKKANEELENWNKMRRLDKIKYLKKKWEKETKEKETDGNKTEKITPIAPKETWCIWREKERNKKTEEREEFDTPENDFDTVSIQMNYDFNRILKQPRISSFYPKKRKREKEKK